MINKKLILIPTSFITISAVTLLTSCGSAITSGESASKLDQTNLVIDLKQMKTVQEIWTSFNQSTNVFMAKPIQELAEISAGDNKDDKAITPAAFENLSAYTNGINFQINSLTLKFGHKTEKFDLTLIKSSIEAVKTKIALGYENFLTKDAIGEKILIHEPISNMSALLAKMMGVSFGFKIIGLASLPANGYADYLKMMDHYHNLAFKMSQSDIFKAWIVGGADELPYRLIKQVQGAQDKYEEDKVKSGAGYDAVKPEDLRGWLPKPLQQAELNNLEAELVALISNLYHYTVESKTPKVSK